MNAEITSVSEARQLLLTRKITADTYSQTVSRIRSQGTKSTNCPKEKAS